MMDDTHSMYDECEMAENPVFGLNNDQLVNHHVEDADSRIQHEEPDYFNRIKNFESEDDIKKGDYQHVEMDVIQLKQS